MIQKFIKTFQRKNNLTDYQMKQLRYVILTFVSEFSKLILLALLFHSYLYEFLFATAVLLLLRSSTGGIHFNTYFGCFAFSVFYYLMSIIILPHFDLHRIFMLLLLFISMIINYYIGAVTSSKRPKANDTLIHKGRMKSFIIIFFYILISYIFPSNQYIIIGFWVIILHTLQLMCAHFLQKGGIIQHGR